MKIVLTGGRGFIGSHMVLALHKKFRGTGTKIIILDALTYAARPWLAGIPTNFTQVKLDIGDQLAVRKFMEAEKPDHIIHMAAESHVCRSITGPKDFVMTNIVGTWNLLEEFKELHGEEKGHRFIHVSTDEVFGEIKKGKFKENSPIAPRSPYSASKASSDHLVGSYNSTYGLDTVIVNCSNNYGPNQHEEKLIPKTITKILTKEPVEIYQSGKQIRDWIYVEDCCEAILKVFDKGSPGERYCIGGEKEMTNLQVVDNIFAIVDKLFKKDGYALKMKFTNSRPTDDHRYAIDTSKIRKLGWKPSPEKFEENLQYTILWYYRKIVSGGATHGRG